MWWRRRRNGADEHGGGKASADGLGAEEGTTPGGQDPKIDYWPNTEHLRNRPPVEHLAKIGHAEPFGTLEEGVAFWQSHGYILEDRSDSRAELKSTIKAEARMGCAYWTLTALGFLVGVFVWPILVLTFVVSLIAALAIFVARLLGQPRERVVLEATPEGVIESRSLVTLRPFS